MQTTFVHIGDFHAAPGPRNVDRYRALDQIITEALALPTLGAWLWPGDLFDAASTVDDRNAIDQRLQIMAGRAPVVLCYGNHDRAGDLAGFANLKAAHPIYVLDRPHVQLVPLATGHMAAVFILPYPAKAGLVAAGTATGAVVEAAGDLLDPIFMAAAAQLAECGAAGYVTLMIGHVNVAGAQLSNGQPSIGHEIELHPRQLDRLGPIPKLLNHIHKPQTIAGAVYAGSVCRLDYGEIELKRWLEVGIGDGAWTGFDGNGPIDGDIRQTFDLRSHLIAVAPMHHVEGVLTRDGFLAPDGGPHSAAIMDWTGCDVRVRYTYKASEKAILNEQRVRDLFKDALRLKVEGVAEPDRELRAPAVAAARTLPEKIAAYRKEAVLPLSVADKLATLETQTPEQLLATVADALAAIERPRDARVAA